MMRIDAVTGVLMLLRTTLGRSNGLDDGVRKKPGAGYLAPGCRRTDQPCGGGGGGGGAADGGMGGSCGAGGGGGPCRMCSIIMTRRVRWS